MLLTSDLASDLMLIYPCYGQSLSVGIPPNITTSVIDATYYKMIQNTASGTSSVHPYVWTGHTLNGLRGLQHASDSQGETTLGSFCLVMGAKMLTQGYKIPAVAFTSGQGGNSFRDLGSGEKWAPVLSQSRTGAGWPNTIRALNYIRQQIIGLGKIPVLMPMQFIHGEEDSGNFNFGLYAEDYARNLAKLAEDFNRDAQEIFNFPSGSPKIPLIYTDTRRTGIYPMWSGGNPILKRGYDGPILGQWLAQFKYDNLINAGANYHLPLHGDGAHLSGDGYFRLGEQIARQAFASTFGKGGPIQFRPIGMTRQSATVIDIEFQAPISSTLALDAVNMPGGNLPDGAYGFLVWDNVTQAKLAITSVAVQSANVIRITLTSGTGAALSRDLWCDYAIWGDTSSDTSATTAGPRGCLRADQGRASLVSDYGLDPVTDYDWCQPFRVPLMPWTGTAVSGRFYGYL